MFFSDGQNMQLKHVYYESATEISVLASGLGINIAIFTP